MKNAPLVFFFFLICLSPRVKAQDSIHLQPCKDSLIQQQADSIKQLVAKDGFTLLRENSITMESEYEIPAIVPLQKGGLYHFVFIGDPSSKLFEVRMYDWDENMIIYQKKAGSEGNIIAFSYVPNVSMHHMFNSLQVNKKKKKGLCGYVMLFRKTKA
ncbi:MAG: hypothetical protein ACXVMS_05020 [Flavisolibacter sp.]